MMVQTSWGWEIAVYLFLGGLAGGTFVVSSILRHKSNDRYPHVAVIAPWVGFLALTIGLLCLLFEVEKPFTAVLMWRSFSNLGSWMAIGAWLLFVAIIDFMICAVFSTPVIADWITSHITGLKSARENIVKVTSILGGVLGFCVAAYTGVLLMAAHSIPMWNTILLPILFTISAMDAGTVVIVACLLAEKEVDTSKAMEILSKALLVLVVLEALAVATLLIYLGHGSANAALSASTLISGDLSVPFWGLVVVVGMCVPFVIEVLDMAGKITDPSLAHKLHIAAIVCALLGGFTLRCVILAAGIHGNILAPDYYMAIMGVGELVL